jgi:hypothetical protein
VQDDATLEAARKAANAGDWCAYLNVQDGINTPLKQQPIQLYRHARLNLKTGEAQTNKYGEVIESIQGIQANDTIVITRLKQWTIQEKAVEIEDVEAEISPTTVDFNSATAMQHLSVLGEGLGALASMDAYGLNVENAPDFAFDLPWSSVINCRKSESTSINEADFLAKELRIEYKKRLKSGEKFDVDCETFVKNLLKKV